MLGSAHLITLLGLSACLVTGELLPEKLINDQNYPNFKNLQIIGGNDTTIEKHPHQISITVSGDNFLAGSILNKYWVVTPAAGLSKFLNTQLSVRVGSNDTNTGGTLYKIEKTILHPKFDSAYWYYDFALHKLSKPLKFGKAVKSINLPKKPLGPGKKVVVSGWGLTSVSMNENGSSFKEIALTTVVKSNCSYAYKSYVDYTLSASQTCAIASYYRNGPFYDHGAPLVSKNILYGQFSFRFMYNGVPCVFNDIYKVVHWIKAKIGA